MLVFLHPDVMPNHCKGQPCIYCWGMFSHWVLGLFQSGLSSSWPTNRESASSHPKNISLGESESVPAKQLFSIHPMAPGFVLKSTPYPTNFWRIESSSYFGQCGQWGTGEQWLFRDPFCINFGGRSLGEWKRG